MAAETELKGIEVLNENLASFLDRYGPPTHTKPHGADVTVVYYRDPEVASEASLTPDFAGTVTPGRRNTMVFAPNINDIGLGGTRRSGSIQASAPLLPDRSSNELRSNVNRLAVEADLVDEETISRMRHGGADIGTAGLGVSSSRDVQADFKAVASEPRADEQAVVAEMVGRAASGDKLEIPPATADSVHTLSMPTPDPTEHQRAAQEQEESEGEDKRQNIREGAGELKGSGELAPNAEGMVSSRAADELDKREKEGKAPKLEAETQPDASGTAESQANEPKPPPPPDERTQEEKDWDKYGIYLERKGGGWYDVFRGEEKVDSVQGVGAAIERAKELNPDEPETTEES